MLTGEGQTWPTLNENTRAYLEKTILRSMHKASGEPSAEDKAHVERFLTLLNGLAVKTKDPGFIDDLNDLALFSDTMLNFRFANDERTIRFLRVMMKFGDTEFGRTSEFMKMSAGASASASEDEGANPSTKEADDGPSSESKEGEGEGEHQIAATALINCPHCNSQFNLAIPAAVIRQAFHDLEGGGGEGEGAGPTLATRGEGEGANAEGLVNRTQPRGDEPA